MQIKAYIEADQIFKMKEGEEFRVFATAGGLTTTRFEIMIPTDKVIGTWYGAHNIPNGLVVQIPKQRIAPAIEKDGHGGYRSVPTPEDNWKTNYEQQCKLTTVSETEFEVPKRPEWPPNREEWVGVDENGNYRRGVPPVAPASGWSLHENEWVADTPGSRPPKQPRTEEW